MAQVRQVVSESLQATIRRLLPSQQGFTEDLQASNVITPIIDLTPSAEGSALPVSMQQCLDFAGTATNVPASSTGTSLFSGTGFVRCFGTLHFMEQSSTATASDAFIFLDDGSTTKNLYVGETVVSTANQIIQSRPFDFIVILKAGVLLKATTGAVSNINVYCRQIADLNGNLVDPDGYTAQ